MERVREPLAGRYRLAQVIGRGGMSTVYRATDAVLGRTVAVKVLLAGLADQDPAYVARFEREARAAAALHHPAVVAVYDVGEDGETRFIVMEHVRGHSLAAMLREGEPFEVAEAVRIGERVASALGAAHAAGIVHRDIKPANVMLAEDGTVKVLDFGVARMLDGTTITQAAAVLGTAAYMAPERARGEPGDARSDVYSLGCLLYAMLAGRPPFSGELAASLLHQHVSSRPRPVGELRGAVPPQLEALVAEMLAKSPEQRPQSASRVGERLAAIKAPPQAASAPPIPVRGADGPTAPTVRASATAATARAPATAPTAKAPATAPTTPAMPIYRGTPALRRGVLAAVLAAAAVLLIAVLVSSGDGSSRQRPAAAKRSRPASTRSTRTPTATPARVVPRPAPGTAVPAAPAPHTPPGHDKGPPPGHEKKPGHGGKHHGDG